ncbi:MAG: FtsW/RodA/SpoVE family cell cycle protein [Gemmatimonadaceae bacterium]
MTAAARSIAAVPGVRVRWRMGVEGRALSILTLAMCCFGLAVLYSASALSAMHEGHESWYYLVRQVQGMAIGAVAFAAGAKIDADRWRKWAWPVMLCTIVLLLVPILPFTTHIAPRIHGSRRWVNVGFAFQPSELAKLSVVIWSAMLVVKKGDQMRRLTKGVLPFLVVIGLLDVLVVLEPDLSQAMAYTLMLGIILFAGGLRVGHVVMLSALAVPVLWKEVSHFQYALMRMMSFPVPGKEVTEINFQLRQSLIAVGSGGFFGKGFGEGYQQNGFLPFPYNDFIGGNIGEEWGFLGLLLVTTAFALYCWLGFRIARGARSPFLKLAAIGLTATVVITAYLHIGVVIGLLPTTGLTLPFFSYGRTNLVLSMLMTGILANIGSERVKVFGEQATEV